MSVYKHQIGIDYLGKVEFMFIFTDAFKIFKEIVQNFEASDKEVEKARQLLDLLSLLKK